MNKFSMVRDINGYNGFGLPFAAEDSTYGGILLGGAEQTVTVPISPFAEAPDVLAVFAFAPGSSIWVSINKTAVAPSGSIDLISTELNPTAKKVNGGDEIHFITNDDSDEFGVSFLQYRHNHEFQWPTFGKIDPLNVTPLVQHWDDAGTNPPPPGTDVRITDAGEIRLTDNGDIRITD